jgi:hypothetical protein
MKRLIFTLTVLCCFLGNAVFGQEIVRTVISEQTYKVTVFKKQLLTQSFLAGDTIIITITEKKEKSLAKIVIEDANSPFKRVAKSVASMEERIVIPADSDYNITLKQRPTIKNPFGVKRLVTVKIEREKFIVPEVVAINEFVDMEDIIVQNRTIKLTQSDTAFMSIFDKKINLGSTIQPGQQTKKAFEITPVPDATYYVYWIGVGKNAIKDYDYLKNNMPPSWLTLGIMEPIEAYALGKLAKMPTRPEGEDVIFALANTKNKNDFLNKTSFKPTFKRQGIVTYGMIDASYISETAPTFVCLQNDNEVSSIDVLVKMVAVTINNTYEEIITDSVITIRKVFRLNTDLMSYEEAKAALNKNEKELAAAWIRSNKEFELAQIALDSAKAARSLELQQAAINLEAERQKLSERENYVNALMEERVQQKIAALDDSEADSTTVAALRLELEAVLTALQQARKELKQVEQQRSQITKLMQQDLKKTGAKEAEKVVDDATRKAAEEAGKTVKETILEGVENTKKVLEEGGN